MGTLPRAVEDFINLCRRPPTSYTLGPVHVVINAINEYNNHRGEGHALGTAVQTLLKLARDTGLTCKMVHSTQLSALEWRSTREATCYPWSNSLYVTRIHN